MKNKKGARLLPQCPHVTKNKKIIFEKYTPLGVLK
jgi:hypothetical protein